MKLAAAKMVHRSLRIAPVLTKRSEPCLQRSAECDIVAAKRTNSQTAFNFSCTDWTALSVFSLMSVVDAVPKCRGGNKDAQSVTKQWLRADASAGLSVSANSELYRGAER